MDKNTLYIILSLLKVAIIISGMVYLLLSFISWRRTRESKELRKIAIIFAGVFLSILILTGIEFIIIFN